MIYLEVRPKTYTLLFHCPCCEGCMKILKKIKGVEAPLEVDVYANKVTISVTGDIQTIISELKCKKAMFSKILPDEQNQHEDEPSELQIVPVKNPVQKEMFSKILPDEQNQHEDEPSELQIVPVENPVQKAMFSKILPDEQNQHEDEPSELQIVPVKNPVQKVTYQQAEFIGGILKAPKLIAYDPYLTTHEHNFELKTYDKRFSCNICREDGYGSRYKCNNGDCPYELHEECKTPKTTVTHDLFSGSTFELSDRLYNADPCIACGKSVCGRFYHCEESKLNLHLRCANLKAKIYESGNCFVLRKKSPNNCLWCEKKEVKGGKSWLYESIDVARCCVHVHCVTEMVQEFWKRRGMRYEDDVSLALALASVDSRNKAVSKYRNKGKYGGVMKIASILLKVVIAILLGDPAALLVATVVELLKN